MLLTCKESRQTILPGKDCHSESHLNVLLAMVRASQRFCPWWNQNSNRWQWTRPSTSTNKRDHHSLWMSSNWTWPTLMVAWLKTNLMNSKLTPIPRTLPESIPSTITTKLLTREASLKALMLVQWNPKDPCQCKWTMDSCPRSRVLSVAATKTISE